MKRILFAMLALPALLLGCQGVSPDDEIPGGTDTSDLKGTITLYADNDIIMADDAYTANLTVLLTDESGVEHDVTSDVDIYYEGSSKPIADPAFRTAAEGEYLFYAVRGFDISNTVSVRAVKGVPALPADPSAGSTAFRHRMMLVQHTGNECPNCPKLMEILKQLASDDDYNTLYHHVASHSYNESDAAYSSAAASLSKTMNTSRNYPMLTFNLTTVDGYFIDEIKGGIEELSKEVAEAGICASASLVGNTVYANVSLKSGADSKYRVAVWLLEDNIHSIQSGANASWQNMHDNCLREMYGSTKNECIYGKPVGTVAKGESRDFIAAIDLQSGWNADNCKLMIIAVAGNGNYDLVNCTVCPLGGTVSYDYL